MFPPCVLAVYLGVKSHHSSSGNRVFVLVSGVGILSQALLSGAPAVSYLSLATWEDTNFLFGSSVLTADV